MTRTGPPGASLGEGSQMAVPLVAEPSPVTPREPSPRTVKGIMRAAGSALPAPRMSTSILAIDGYGGAGKSTLAVLLVEEFLAQGLRVDLVHTDDFASADDPLNWWPRMIDQILEGVSASRDVFRPYLSLAVWVEMPADERLRRGLERDGEQARDQWRRWMAEEVAWGDAERPWERADVVVPGVGDGS